ncbi:hypothetical protein [Dyadobacter sp. NIV53]|uniref:hypothetical protein n=1 Tax=Dyadobacter sp. NIV53 TaxID=2861765 RepID=UPI001C868B7C|nr:hypothetical protein [Dyadobacter sp. NIV53]
MLLLSAGIVGISCNEKEVADDLGHEVVTARILRPTCGGIAMQLIGASFDGDSWKYYANTKGPFDSTNTIITYEHCVLVGNVPLDKQVIGDTLMFTYVKGLTPGNYCDLGGLPKYTISVKRIR